MFRYESIVPIRLALLLATVSAVDCRIGSHRIALHRTASHRILLLLKMFVVCHGGGRAQSLETSNDQEGVVMSRLRYHWSKLPIWTTDESDQLRRRTGRKRDAMRATIMQQRGGHFVLVGEVVDAVRLNEIR